MANTGMLVSMEPTSISHSGTSASVNNNGGVDFTAVTSLSLNGVFTGDYDNYLIVINYTNASGGNVNLKLRASGTDATGSNYTYQTLIADGSSSPSGTRYSSESSWARIMHADSTYWQGFNVHLYGPALAQPTAARSVSVSSYNSAFIRDVAGTHSLSTSYDGFTIGSSAMTGNIHVFGYRE